MAKSGSTRANVGEAEENPAPLLATLGEASVDQDPHVARYTRLALAEHLGELADRELHRARNSAMMRNRVGSPSAWNRSARGSVGVTR